MTYCGPTPRHGEDVALHAEDEPTVLPVLREPRTDPLQVRERLPVELLGDVRVARAVGVGEGVALGRGRLPDAVQFRLVQTCRVADFVQARRLGDLPVEQGQDMAGAGERADVGARLPREAIREPLGNPLDDLPQGGVLCFRWPRGGAVRLLKHLHDYVFRNTAARLLRRGCSVGCCYYIRHKISASPEAPTGVPWKGIRQLLRNRMHRHAL